MRNFSYRKALRFCLSNFSTHIGLHSASVDEQHGKEQSERSHFILKFLKIINHCKNKNRIEEQAVKSLGISTAFTLSSLAKMPFVDIQFE